MIFNGVSHVMRIDDMWKTGSGLWNIMCKNFFNDLLPAGASASLRRYNGLCLLYGLLKFIVYDNIIIPHALLDLNGSLFQSHP